MPGNTCRRTQEHSGCSIHVGLLGSAGLVVEGATEARSDSEGWTGVPVQSSPTLPEASATASFTTPSPGTRLAQHSAWHRQDLINVYLLKE